MFIRGVLNFLNDLYYLWEMFIGGVLNLERLVVFVGDVHRWRAEFLERLVFVRDVHRWRAECLERLVVFV
ncbi:hypothetical protein DPMN_025352 [Dreissena polymorpha]|uniref:Uncharacterized protein n=1 Tax=Dreissena polymorpha TaxID=45954 RepID=A0A9D4LQZ0_DREPO|nr:hypothetical protein DPMN_025352 [Dreissena polymorpha]